MKRIGLIIIAALAVCCQPLHTGDESVVIDGRISGIPEEADSVQVGLFQLTGGSGKGVCRFTMQDDRFHIVLDSLPSGSRRYQLVLLRFWGKNPDVMSNSSDLFLEPGAHIHFNSDARSLHTARIKSPVGDQILAQRFLEKLPRRERRLADELMSDYYTLSAETRYNTELTRDQRDSLRKIGREIMARRDSVQALVTAREFDLLETEEIGAFAMREIESLAHSAALGRYTEHKDQLLRIVDRLNTDQKNSPEGQAIMNFLFPIDPVSVGETVPEYSFVDKGGQTHTLGELRGRPVLVDFWANGCAPCIQSIPYLQQLYQELGGRAEFVSINLDQDEVWKSPASPGARNEVPWLEWRDPKEFAGNYRAYGSRGIPTFLVISPDGVLTDVSEGFNMTRLRDLLNSF